ncbi:gluconokinase [Alteromonadaceae bacterium M269]|nr:gluconokinase [Alteromonadaceae bacterium M269]
MSAVTPILVIVMGVSGVGKSTIASTVATRLNMAFIEADEFHSDEAIQSMGCGIPLTDELRQGWIECLCNAANQYILNNQSVVLAYSGLKTKHRAQFSALPCRTLFLLLDASFDLLRGRLAERKNHFFPESLLQSQFEDFEPLTSDINSRKVNAERAEEFVIDECLKHIRDFKE